MPPAVFKTASSSGRMTSVASCGSWNRTNGFLVQSQALLPTATTPHRLCSTTRIVSRGSPKAAGAGIEPADATTNAVRRCPKPGITTNSDDPAMLCSEGRAGLEPARWYLTGTCSAAELPTQSNSKSALRESNPPRRFGRPEPLPLGQEHVVVSGKGGSRTLKAVKLVPVRAGCHRQLACPSVCRSCGGRNRTCVATVNSRLPVPAQDPPHQTSQDGWI